jgi:hypothetical protein
VDTVAANAYTADVWNVEMTHECQAWFLALVENEAAAVTKVVDMLAVKGPGLRRPLIGKIASSRHHNMRELCATAENIRILFAFDPRRTAILLIGGSKSKRWREWYRVNVPLADDLYDGYLAELREEGLL